MQSSQSCSDDTVSLGLPKGIWFCQRRSLTHFIYTCQNEAGRLTFSFRVPAWITRLELSARNAMTADCKHFIDLLSSLVRVTYVQGCKSILLSEALQPSKASYLCHLVVSFHLPVNEGDFSVDKQLSRASSGNTGWVCPGVIGPASVLQVRRWGLTVVKSLPWK